MLLNLLNEIAYWFDKNDPITGIKDGWVRFLWYVFIILDVICVLVIVVLFFVVLRLLLKRKSAPVQQEIDQEEEPEEEPTEEEEFEIPAPVVAMAAEEEGSGRLYYNRSFESKLIQSDDEVKGWYAELKNLMLCYRGCKARMSWRRETFRAHKMLLARLVFRGNTLCLFLPLDIDEYEDNRGIENGAMLRGQEETPVLLRIKNERRKRLAFELIAKVMEENGLTYRERPAEDFYVPYESDARLINRGLIKRQVITVNLEDVFDQNKK